MKQPTFLRDSHLWEHIFCVRPYIEYIVELPTKSSLTTQSKYLTRSTLGDLSAVQLPWDLLVVLPLKPHTMNYEIQYKSNVWPKTNRKLFNQCTTYSH